MAGDGPTAGERAGSGRAWRRGKGVALLVAAILLVLLLWGIWSVVQWRAAMARGPAARRATAACTQLFGWAVVYRITPLGSHGVICSALVHQQTYYSYALGNVVPAHWARLDCAVGWPRGAPLCSEHILHGADDWIALAGPPAAEVTTLGAAGVP